MSLPAPPPSFKTDFRLASFMFGDETKLSGAATILRKYSDEFNLTDESKILLWMKNPKKNRLEGFVPVLGGFHFRWKFLREVMDSHWRSQKYSWVNLPRASLLEVETKESTGRPNTSIIATSWSKIWSRLIALHGCGEWMAKRASAKKIWMQR